jgi:hypothetical protein
LTSTVTTAGQSGFVTTARQSSFVRHLAPRGPTRARNGAIASRRVHAIRSHLHSTRIAFLIERPGRGGAAAVPGTVHSAVPGTVTVRGRRKGARDAIGTSDPMSRGSATAALVLAEL